MSGLPRGRSAPAVRTVRLPARRRDAAPAVLVAIDFETAGFEAHSACAVGLARIENGRMAGFFYSLLRPPSSRVMFTEIHGLTWAMLKDAPAFAEIWPEMLAFFEGAECLLAHNAAFDRRVLEGCCRAALLPVPVLPFRCTLKGVRGLTALSGRAGPSGKPPSGKLSEVCARFGIALRHHHAGSDAAACAKLYLRLRRLGVMDERMRL
jgi:DNA polymerase-3 subunit epsilon